MAKGAVDHEKYRALYRLGSTMSFNTLIDADRLANLAISMLAEFTAARRGYLTLFDDEGEVRHRFGIEVGEDVRDLGLDGAAERRMLDAAAGGEGSRSEDGHALTAVLVCEESTVGAMLLERNAADPPFDPGDLALVEACAAHLAQSLRSRQLYESHMAQRRRVELFDRVTRAVNSPNDLEEILAIIVRTASEALSAAAGALILGDTAGRLGVAIPYRMREGLVDSELRPAESRMVRWVFTEGTPFCDGERVIAPVKQVLRDRRVFDERRRSLHASAFVRTLGVLYLEGPLQRGPFSEEDLMTLGVFADHVAAAVANNALLQQASTDALTRLESRRQFETRLSEEFEFARRHGIPLSLIMADVDHFKKVNDSHGHPVGDEVLVEVAAILREAVRKYDQCARYGGEEFMIVLPETRLYGAEVVAENIRRRVEGGLFSRERIPVTISLGVAEFPLHAATPEGLVRKVDRALYEAKSSGRNRTRAATAG
ncbi:MAG: diguanylate cyclase [Acidobacteria bacterium]|nr:diguanylate cyclase [Acidobacteriota bacterium]